MIAFPNIDPTAFSLFGIDIQWYGSLCYCLLFGLLNAKRILKKEEYLNSKLFDDLFLWIALGTIIGGRVGYVIFYDFKYYLNNLILIILDIRKGGMSFHGGLLGVITATYIFSTKKMLVF